MRTRVGWLGLVLWIAGSPVLALAQSGTAEVNPAEANTAEANTADGDSSGQDASTDRSEAEAQSLEREAQALFEAGRTAFSAGRYENALETFRRAYELAPLPELMFNIATAADRLRYDAEALEAFETYLELAPDASNRLEVEGRVVALRERVGQSTQTEDSSGPGAAPWIFVAAGSVISVVGAVSLGFGFNDISRVENAEDGVRLNEIQASIDRAPLLTGFGIAGLAVGLSAVAAGVIWLVAASDESPPAEATQRVRLAPGGFSF